MAEGGDTAPGIDPNSHIDAFFSIAAEAVRSENKFLAEHLAACDRDGFYCDYHQGVQFLFETTLVYLIFRGLLAADFVRRQQCEARWEESYPHSVEKKVDLLLRPRGSLPADYIECKIWKHEYAEDLKADIYKMSELPPEHRRFLLTLWWESGDGADNLQWLTNNLNVKVAHYRCFPTGWRNRHKQIESRNSVLALLELSSPAR